MKTAFLVLLAFPLMVLAQTKNVLSIERVFPKIEKAAEFNKALANHAQKYHTGSWKWRVYDITTGPDYGGVMIVEGPNSWTDIDKRGDISAEHMDDWNKNIAPLILQNQQSQMLEYEETLSSVPLTAFTKWINITHLYQNPGYTGVTTDLIKQLKALWTAENETVAVYTVASSGAQQFATRLHRSGRCEAPGRTEPRAHRKAHSGLVSAQRPRSSSGDPGAAGRRSRA